MLLKSVVHEAVLVPWTAVLRDGAVVTDELLTCLAINLELLAFVQGAVKGHLL